MESLEADVSRGNRERPDFDHQRFRLVARLGSGSHGAVYRAEDRRSGAEVALKILHDDRPTSVRALKADFRRLADLVHPNLTDYYELFWEGGRVFFTMRLLEGVDLVTWARLGLTRFEPLPSDRAQALWGIARGLAAGLSELHGRGLLHRDVKPSNIFVEDGQGVFLDFGFAAESESVAADPRPLGTPRYMAPELLVGGSSSASSDWFALGSVLHEALTGVPVRRGNEAELPDTPLGRAVRRLVRERAEERGGAEVFMPPGRAASEPASRFVGRSDPLEQLDAIWRRIRRRRRAEHVSIRAASGMGKSALIDHVIERWREEGPITVLRGRCHPRERVPFPAIDGWIDQIVASDERFLAALGDVDVSVDFGALGVVFPAFLEALEGLRPVCGAARCRLEASRALGALLAALSRRAPLVLVIDDAQWTDPDSRAVLEVALSFLRASPALLLCAERTDLRDASRPLDALEPELTELDLAPLSLDEGVALLEQRGLGSASERRRWARESAGSPLLLELLARLGSAAIEGDPWRVALDARLDALSPVAREVFEQVCVHGASVTREDLAVGDPSEVEEALISLTKERWLRSELGATEPCWVPQHDRIREAALRNMSPEAVQRAHARIGQSLAGRGAGAAEVAVHMVAAGVPEASAWARRAGDEALRQHAYLRAIHWLRAALVGAEGEGRLETLGLLGEAARLGGQVEVEVEARRAAAAQALVLEEEDVVLEHRCRVAEALLSVGRLEEGRRGFDELLLGVGWRLRSPCMTRLAEAQWSRWRSRRRIDTASAPGLSARDRRRLEVAYTAVSALGLTDAPRAVVLQAEHLRLALRSGVPELRARALSMELVYLSGSGGAGPEVEGLQDRLRSMIFELEPREIRAFAHVSLGYAAFLRGEVEEARLGLEAGVELNERIGCATWAARFAELHLAVADLFGGATRLAMKRAELLAQTPDARDVLTQTYLELGISHYGHLLADAPERVEALASRCLERWSEEPPVFVHLAKSARCLAALYRNDAVLLRQIIEETPRSWLATRAFQSKRVLDAWFDGRLALLEGHLGEAGRRARQLASEHRPWATGLGLLLDSGVHVALGKREAAAKSAARAHALLESSGMHLFATPAELWKAELEGDDQTRTAVLERLAAGGAARPEVLAGVFVPRSVRV